MSKTVQVTCDGCGNDLTYTANCEDFRLALVNERVPLPPGDGVAYSMGAYPAIKTDAHFCGVECLRSWLDSEYPADRRYHGGFAFAAAQRKARAGALHPSSHSDSGSGEESAPSPQARS